MLSTKSLVLSSLLISVWGCGPSHVALDPSQQNPNDNISNSSSAQEISQKQESVAVGQVDLPQLKIGNRVVILKDILEEVSKRDEVQPGYPDWDGINRQKLKKKPGVQPGIVWPQRAVYLAMAKTGKDVEIILQEHEGERLVDWTSPFGMLENIESAILDEQSDVRELSENDAKILSNLGETILAFGVVSTTKRDVRIGIVVPDENTTDMMISTVSPKVEKVRSSEWAKIVKEKKVRYILVPDNITQTLDYDQVAATKLMSKIKNVVARTIYQPGYPSWNGINVKGLPKKPGAEPGVTWCNEAAYRIADEMGHNTSVMLNSGGIDYTNANDMYFNLFRASLRYGTGVVQIDQQTAQQAANRGEVVVVATPAKGLAPGHIGIVAPKNANYSPRIGPSIGQAGAFNGIVTYRRWRVDWGKAALFFTLPKK